MSREEIAKQLRGSRKDVQSAAKAIQEQFQQIRNGGTSSVALYALNYEVHILRQLCCALQDNLHQHADIYCKIAASMMPYVEPCISKPDFWISHLTSLQYIHHSLCREHTMAECKKFYALVNSQCCQLQNKSNYKFYLSLHIKHLFYFSQQIQKQITPEHKAEISHAVQGLRRLFQAMLDQQHCPSQLISELNEILGKRSNGFLKILGASSVEHINQFCEVLFQLLLCVDSKAQQELTTQFPEYMSAFLALLQLDGCAWHQQSPTQQPWALQLLRSCRAIYKEQSAQSYTLQLTYYYLKVLYTRDAKESIDIKRTYIDLVKKFVNFFEVKCVTFAQEQWFIDYLLVLLRLQKHLHQIDSKLPSFDGFWRELGGEQSEEAYAAHFKLLECLTNMHMNISKPSLLAPTCSNDANCQSLRKHCIYTLGFCANVAYSNWPPAEQSRLSKASQQTLAITISYAMEVAKVTKCMKPTSGEMINFVWHLANIADKVSNATQMSLVQQLFKSLQVFRSLLGDQETRHLFRRIYKASAHCDDQELAAQLQSTYIAAMHCPVRQFQQMSFYYRNAKKDIQSSLYELHEQSPLCNTLTALQKRSFYELDMLAVWANKKTPTLLLSLMRHRQTEYHMVLLGRQMRTENQILQQFEELRLQLLAKKQLTRLQQLLLGHASVTKLLESLEAKKIKIPISETAEKTLEQLVKNKLLDLNIRSEVPMLELATTAIDAFESFYKLADIEPISSDEARIDWDALIDDIIVAAMALSTMGYTIQADKAWLLLLRIGRLLGDRFTYLRALTHFMSRYTHHALLNMSDEVEHAQQLLFELWPQLHDGNFLKRQHTTVLLSLCYMALYYARQNSVCHAQLLLVHAKRLRDEFEERVGKCDIVHLTMQVVRFRMCYQQRHCNILDRMPTALQQLDTLADEVRNFSSISSIDHGALILLLSDLVQDSTECTANRLSERPNLSSSLLQILLQSGLVMRTVEVLISWLWTNLRMECLDKALSKLRLIDHFLCIQPLLQSMSMTNRVGSGSSLAAAPMDDQTKHMSELVGKMLTLQLESLSGTVEPLRRQQQLTNGASPRLKIRSPRASHPKLQRYVNINMEEMHPVLRDNVQLQCIYFIVGCLHARLYYLNREHEQLDDFFVLTNDWLQQDNSRSQALGHMLLLLHIYQANYLRSKRKHQEAIELTQSALKLANNKQLTKHIDINYRYNLILQLRTAQLELNPLPLSSKSQTLRRALKFNITPEEKPTAVGRAHTKAIKPAKFAIYTEDAVITNSSHSSISNSSEGSSPELDLNVCQRIEIIDISDDDDQQQQKLKAQPKQAKGTRSTRTRAQKQIETPAVPVAPVRQIATAPPTLTKSSASISMPEETPKTTTATRGRPRRQNVAEQPATTPLPLASSVSTRRRPRN